MYQITASIVAYRNDVDVLVKAVNSFLKTDLKVKLFISDNSPDDRLRAISSDTRIEYIFNNRNLGFGRGHNVCILKAKEISEYHLILNPDVYFDEGVLEELKNYMDLNKKVGLIAPKVLYPDGCVQHSCRLLPLPIDFLIRRIGFLRKIFHHRVQTHELAFTGYNEIMEVPFLLGCFLLIRSKVFSEIGMFDDRFFLYLEDVDLCRRIHLKHKTIFFPFVNIYHYYEKASAKNLNLFKIHVKSIIKYFNKWGWFSYQESRKINYDILRKLKK